MDDLELTQLLVDLEQVQAPTGLVARVLRMIAEERQARQRRIALCMETAGTAGVGMAAFVMVYGMFPYLLPLVAGMGIAGLCLVLVWEVPVDG